MQIDEKLNIVECLVTYAPRTNRLIVNERICKKITTECLNRLKSYEISSIKKEPLEGIGGGDSPLSEVLSFLWQERKIIATAITIGRHLFAKTKFYVNEAKESKKPTLIINLSISSGKAVEDWHAPVSEKLADLKYLADDLALYLKTKYPIYNFDLLLSVSLPYRKYKAYVYQPAKKVSSFNDFKLLRCIKSLKVSPNRSVSIGFSKPFVLRTAYSYIESADSLDSIHLKTKRRLI